MQIVIDIPEEAYEIIKKDTESEMYIIQVIKQGIPLDKIRAEIKEEIEAYRMSDWESNDLLADGLQMALNIMDSYRGCEDYEPPRGCKSNGECGMISDKLTTDDGEPDGTGGQIFCP